MLISRLPPSGDTPAIGPNSQASAGLTIVAPRHRHQPRRTRTSYTGAGRIPERSLCAFQQRRPASPRAFAVVDEASVLDFRRQLAAIGGELGHHLLVQPDVHARGIIAVAGVAELLGELLARREARIDVERLHQVDDRGAPLQLFALGFDSRVEDRCDIDGCRRAGAARSAGRCRRLQPLRRQPAPPLPWCRRSRP